MQKNIETRQVTITMERATVDPKRSNFWPGEHVRLHSPDSKVMYEIHKREYLDKYDNWILDLHDIDKNVIKHVDTHRTNIYLVHEHETVNSSESYNFNITAYYVIANRTGLNLTYSFTHRKEISSVSDLPENVHGCNLHSRFNNYTNLMVPKVKKFIKHPPISRMCTYDPPHKPQQKTQKPSMMQILIQPKEDLKEMRTNPKYYRIPTLLLKTRTRQIDATNHLLLFNPHTGWTQKENIMSVGVDTMLKCSATGGKGDGFVQKRRKNMTHGMPCHSSDATYLNKGDALGVDNVILCNVRSMFGKLSKNILVQLEAPILIKNELKVAIYLRLTSTGTKYNQKHPTDETYGLPIIEVLPEEIAKVFVDPNLRVIEMGVRNPFVPTTTMKTTNQRMRQWPKGTKCPIVWGTPMDLSLNDGKISVQTQTQQYNQIMIIETKVTGMFDAGGARHVQVRRGTAKYMIENRSTRFTLYYGELNEKSITSEVSKYLKSMKSTDDMLHHNNINRIIGTRHNLFGTKEKLTLDCLSKRKFAFSPRSPSYLTIGIIHSQGISDHTHSNNIQLMVGGSGSSGGSVVNQGDNENINGALTVDVEVTGTSTPLILKIPRKKRKKYNQKSKNYRHKKKHNKNSKNSTQKKEEKDTQNQDQDEDEEIEYEYLHLILEIYTDGVHNVISIADSMNSTLKLHTTNQLRMKYAGYIQNPQLHALHHRNHHQNHQHGHKTKKNKKNKNKTKQQETKEDAAMRSPRSNQKDPTLSSSSHSSKISSPSSPATTVPTLLERQKFEGSGTPFQFGHLWSWQFGSISLVLIDEEPKELLALTLEEISCEWSLTESVFTIEHFQIDDMTVGSLTPIVLEPSRSGYNSSRDEAWRLRCRDYHAKSTFNHNKSNSGQSSSNNNNNERNQAKPNYYHTRLDPWLICKGKKAPTMGLTVYNECDLSIGDICLNIDLKYILADVTHYSSNIMPELFQMLGYPKLSDIDSVLEILLWGWFPDEGFANNYGMTSDMYFRLVRVADCNLKLSLLTDAFINTRDDQIDALGDSIKGIIKMLGPSMELSPTIKFDRQTMSHEKLNWLGLLSNWISLAFQNTRQMVYKLLGSFSSMKMFGNVGGLTEQFIETTKTSAKLAQQGYYGRAGCRVGQSFFSGVFRCMGSTAEAGTCVCVLLIMLLIMLLFILFKSVGTRCSLFYLYIFYSPIFYLLLLCLPFFLDFRYRNTIWYLSLWIRS